MSPRIVTGRDRVGITIGAEDGCGEWRGRGERDRGRGGRGAGFVTAGEGKQDADRIR